MATKFIACKRNFTSSVNHGIQIYCCKTKQKVPMVLKNPLFSSWYTCGPTVYDSAHIGHASTYVRLDILQRILRNHFKINLITCMNITNIDDKIIKKSNETGREWKLIADEYEAEFWEDLESLNVVQPNIKLRVTDKIPEIIKFIEELEKKGFTKTSNDGSVYFTTSKYYDYGKLEKVSTESIETSAADFALWKGSKPNEPVWETKWGKGRPGWHIECSTLASLMFGSHIDFHAGGVDLKFPHHENEEAQSCVHHSVKNWVTNWLHTGHLHLKGQSEKMSKSLKNTVTIRELLKEHSSDQFRLACLLSHYRSSIEFGPELLLSADSILKRLQSFEDDSQAYIKGLKLSGSADFEQEIVNSLSQCQEKVDGALRDDFNTSRAVGSILELMSSVSKKINSPNDHQSFTTTSNEKMIVQGVVNYVNQMFKTFGVGETGKSERSSSDFELESLINSVVTMRNEIRLKAKESKDKQLFGVCDTIRNALKQNRIQIKDHGELSSWNKING